MRSRHPLSFAFSWILGVGALAGIAASQAAPARETAPASEPRDVIVLGASLSAGFVCPWTDESRRINQTVRLRKGLDALWERDVARIRDRSDVSTFLDPVTKQGKHVERAVADDPDLLVAVDFLFWFGYGYVRGADQGKARLELLEQGLAMLDEFDCPIVVGDFPDMTGADPRMLKPRQIPTPDVQAKLNARVREWAASREHVILFPLAEWVEEMHSTGRKAVVDGAEVRIGPRWLMQTDRLHPTKLGVALVADGVRQLLAKHFETDHPLACGDVTFVEIVDEVRADIELDDALAEPVAEPGK